MTSGVILGQNMQCRFLKRIKFIVVNDLAPLKKKIWACMPLLKRLNTFIMTQQFIENQCLSIKFKWIRITGNSEDTRRSRTKFSINKSRTFKGNRKMKVSGQRIVSIFTNRLTVLSLRVHPIVLFPWNSIFALWCFTGQPHPLKNKF